MLLYYVFLFICSTWFLDNVATKDSREDENSTNGGNQSEVTKHIYHSKATLGSQSIKNRVNFNVMPLSYSSLLMFWDVPEKFNILPVMNFSCEAINEKGEPISNKTYFSQFFVDDGETMISGLNESTRYRVTLLDNAGYYEYSVESKTRPKTNENPAKPHFTYQYFLHPHNLKLYILWQPCGKGRCCFGKEAGSSFSLKYKFSDRPTLQEVKINILSRTFIVLDLFADRKYQIRVTSVNNGLETDSDVEEIQFPSGFGPIQTVRVISLSNSTALIFWQPPAIISDNVSYYDFSYAPLNHMINSTLQLEYLTGKHWNNSIVEYVEPDENLQKISSLNMDTDYAFSILPFNEDSPDSVKTFGSEFKGKFRVKPYNVELPLATPDFDIYTTNYITDKTDEKSCIVRIKWYPCGKLFDCKNARPGLNFIVNYKTVNHTKFDGHLETRQAYCKIQLIKNLTYDVSVKSVDGSKSSNSSAITFKCI